MIGISNIVCIYYKQTIFVLNRLIIQTVYSLFKQRISYEYKHCTVKPVYNGHSRENGILHHIHTYIQ